jgi:hypothetical protein
MAKKVERRRDEMKRRRLEEQNGGREPEAKIC